MLMLKVDINYHNSKIQMLIYALMAMSFLCYIIIFTGGLATEYPEPKDKLQFIVSKMYDAKYDSPLPNQYDWPDNSAKPRILPEK